jgi:ribose/xylose/arabinose/galactoside ABC-type transport system permease subunit
MPAPAALVLGVALATAIGLANGLLVWRISTSPIIITLGSLSLLYGVALLLSHGVNVPDVPDAYTQLGRAHVLGIPSALLAFIVIAIGAALFLATTVPGRHLYAIGGNREASLRVGIRLRRIVLAAFAFNGLLVGLAAIFEASRFGTASPEFGIGLEVDVITAVILGGVAFWGGEGTLTGVLLAVIFLGILESGLVSLGIDPFYADVVRGGALIVAVSLEQFSRERRERQRKALAMAERGP